MRFLLPIICLALLAAVCSCSSEDVQVFMDPDDRERFDKGMEIADKLAGFFAAGGEAEKFGELVKNLGAMGGPILGAVASLVSLVLSFFTKPAESPELIFMKNKFREVNTKLDRMFHKFNEVKSLIKWSAVELSYVHHEQKILNMENIYNRLLETSDPNLKNYLKMELIRTYEQSALTLYRAFAENDQVLSKNVVVAAMDHMNNDRRKVQYFMTGFVQLVIRGSKLDVAYTRLAYPENPAAAEHVIDLWRNRWVAMQHRMGHFDGRVARNYRVQVNRDIDQMVPTWPGIYSNQHAANVLAWFLREKYYWLVWFVLVFGDEKSRPGEHYAHITCWGYTRFNFYGRNIIVSMSDPNKSVFSHSSAMWHLNSIAGWEAKDNKPGTWIHRIQHIIGQEPCVTNNHRFVSRVALCWGCGVGMSASPGRLGYRWIEVRNKKGRVHVFLFG